MARVAKAGHFVFLLSYVSGLLLSLDLFISLQTTSYFFLKNYYIQVQKLNRMLYISIWHFFKSYDKAYKS